MKKIFIIILCLVLCAATLPSASANAAASAVTYRQTLYKDKDSEDFLWDTLNKYSPTPELTASIIGYFWRESCYKSNAIAFWSTIDNQNKKDNSAEFTQTVDTGLLDGSTKEYFIDQVHNHLGGYGLGQWHAELYLDALYDFAQDWGTSISDAEMQCAFTVWSIYNLRFPYIKELDETSVIKSSHWMSYTYDGSFIAAGVIQLKAETIYKEKMPSN